MNDLELLKEFCYRADQILETTVFKEKKLKASINIKYDKGVGTKLKRSGPDYDQFVTLLALLRPFLSTKDDISFKRVYNVVWQLLDEQPLEVKECAQSISKAYKELLNKFQIKMVFNNEILKPKTIIDVWFNGNYFHQDKIKSEKFKELKNSPMSSSIEFEFQSIFLELANLFVYFSSFIKAKILKEEKL